MKEIMSGQQAVGWEEAKHFDPGVREKQGGAIHMAKISLGFRKFQKFA